MRIAILTGGGDAPGLNAAIRAVVKTAASRGDTVIGLEDGFRGLIEPDRWRRLEPADVTGILREGGTILGTTNHANPLRHRGPDGHLIDCSSTCVDRFRALSLDALIVAGGDGTLAIAYELWKRGLPIVGIPKTIDNDVVETNTSIGFDTAVAVLEQVVGRTKLVTRDSEIVRAACSLGISFGSHSIPEVAPSPAGVRGNATRDLGRAP